MIYVGIDIAKLNHFAPIYQLRWRNSHGAVQIYK